MISLPIYTTGIHYTDQSVEWAVLCNSKNGTETLRKGSLPIPPGFFEQQEAPLFPAEVLAEVRKSFKGIVTIALPSSQLLMRVLELPSTDPGELRDMVGLQIDQLSPFPADQLTISYEVLHQNEDHSRVLAVAAQRKWVDRLGDLFKEQNIYLRSLDAEVLAWWSLLVQHGEVPAKGRVVIILEEHTEFSMIIVDEGIPVCFRSLELFHDFSKESTLHDIVEELRYTLLSLETQYGQRETRHILFWSEAAVPEKLCELLREQSGAHITLNDLSTIPPVSEGLALRSLDRKLHHAELIPREWVDLQRHRQIMRAVTVAIAAVLGLWLSIVFISGIVFSIRQFRYKRVARQAETYAAPARAAQAAREEMLSLERYADRSHSALEALREVTATLPEGVEITSFSYKKGNAVSLRGSSERAELIYDYFQKLGASELFEGVKDQPVSTRMVKGQRISTFAITAELPSLEIGEEQP